MELLGCVGWKGEGKGEWQRVVRGLYNTLKEALGVLLTHPSIPETPISPPSN